MLEILETLHKYVPYKKATLNFLWNNHKLFYMSMYTCIAVNSIELSMLLFMGDQLTVERAHNVVKSRVNASSQTLS